MPMPLINNKFCTLSNVGSQEFSILVFEDGMIYFNEKVGVHQLLAALCIAPEGMNALKKALRTKRENPYRLTSEYDAMYRNYVYTFTRTLTIGEDLYEIVNTDVVLIDDDGSISVAMPPMRLADLSVILRDKDKVWRAAYHLLSEPQTFKDDVIKDAILEMIYEECHISIECVGDGKFLVGASKDNGWMIDE